MFLGRGCFRKLRLFAMRHNTGRTLHGSTSAYAACRCRLTYILFCDGDHVPVPRVRTEPTAMESGGTDERDLIEDADMVVYYIQLGAGAWYVMRDGEPTARCLEVKRAIAVAMLLARGSRKQGEDAVFAGIATEPMDMTTERAPALDQVA